MPKTLIPVVSAGSLRWSRAAATPRRFRRASEPVRARPGRLHDRDRQSVLADGARDEVGVPRDGRRGNEQRVVVTVTNETREVMGIEARVVHDLVTEGGVPVEDTYDWYAQDADGNVWYLGEDTKEYEDGKVVSTAGSWEAGVDGAQPGIAVPGAPEVGLTYRQEYYAGEAEDAAAVLSLDEQVEAPLGRFTGVLMTKDSTPLQPEILEYKFYARGSDRSSCSACQAGSVARSSSSTRLRSPPPGCEYPARCCFTTSHSRRATSRRRRHGSRRSRG